MNLKKKQKAKAFYSLIFVVIAFLLVSLGTVTSLGNNGENQTYSNISPESSDEYTSQVEIDDLSANNWTWAKIAGYCIGSGTELDPYVIGNDTFSFASGDALVIKNSRKHFRIINCTFKDSNSAGLLLDNITNGLLINNTAYNNLYGIHIYESWDVNVTECIFNINDQYNLNVDHSDNNTMLLNTIVGKHDGDVGFRLYYSHNNLIVNNTFSKVDGSPMALVYSNNNEIIGNNCSHPILKGSGVSFFDSHNNFMSKNLMSRCLRGFSLTGADYNVFSDNVVKDTIHAGFGATNSEYNIFINNTFNNASSCHLGSESKFNQILNNNISNNIYSGIDIVNSDDTVVLNNYLDNNTIGIRVYFGSERNNFSGNVIKNSKEREFTIDTNCYFNYVFNNTFVGNSLPAEDNCTNNFWDNGKIGNSWDNYVGVDLDDNGIGDTPYNITGTAGSQDRYPIYEDGDDLGPQITINSPTGWSVFGEDAPTFDLTIYDINLDAFWYTIQYSTIKHFVSVSNGENLIAIAESIWDALPDGHLTFRFFVNDTTGNENYAVITIIKDGPEVPGIPGFNNAIIIGSVLALMGLLAFEIKKKKKII